MFMSLSPFLLHGSRLHLTPWYHHSLIHCFRRNFASDYQHVKKVGIIGAGVAGIQMARSLKAAGYECTVFDKAPSAGGLWVENYHGSGIQAPKEMYEFPDFEWSEAKKGSFPSTKEVKKYIEGFVENFQLSPLLRLNTAVAKVSLPENKQGWNFHLQHPSGSKTEHFDYAVVASGMYSQTKNMPRLRGAQEFESAGKKILHSSEYLTDELAKGKKVVVLGCGKSAIDIVTDTAKVSDRSTLLFRNAHWGVPQKLAGLIPFQDIFCSRFGQFLVNAYVGELPNSCTTFSSPWQQPLLSNIFTPIFKAVELLFKFQLQQTGSYEPKVDLVEDLYGYAQILSSEFKQMRKFDQIDTVHGRIHKLSSEGIRLQSGETLPCDVLICATGFSKTYDYLPKEIQEGLDIEKDGLWLYRHCIPPSIPNLAFCGSEIATISNITTHGLQAEWITAILQGKVTLPNQTDMMDEIKDTKEWKRSWMPLTSSRANLVLLHQIQYHDQLLADMQLNNKRKQMKTSGFAGTLKEYLEPYLSKDYNNIITSS